MTKGNINKQKEHILLSTKNDNIKYGYLSQTNCNLFCNLPNLVINNFQAICNLKTKYLTRHSSRDKHSDKKICYFSLVYLQSGIYWMSKYSINPITDFYEDTGHILK